MFSAYPLLGGREGGGWWSGLPHLHPTILLTTGPMSFLGGIPVSGPMSPLPGGGYPSPRWERVTQDRGNPPPLGQDRTGDPPLPKPGQDCDVIKLPRHQDRTAVPTPPLQRQGTLRAVRLLRFSAGLSCLQNIWAKRKVFVILTTSYKAFL